MSEGRSSALDCGLPWVTETMESKTEEKQGLLYTKPVIPKEEY